MGSSSQVPVYLTPGAPNLQHDGLECNVTLSTEVLPGPPSLFSIQQSFQKRDLKKPVYSYLPATDPGTTYCGSSHGTTSHPPQVSDLLLNRASIRGQRASARNHNGQPVAVPSPPSSSMPGSASQDTDDISMTSSPAVSRSTSVTRTRRKDKPNDTTAAPTLRFKEEGPACSSLTPPEPPPPPHENDEICSSCSSQGKLVNCDGCPRSFHLLCLDPPLEHVDEGDSKWFCPCCLIRKNPSLDPPHSLFAPLLQHLQSSPPHEYQLPAGIRDFFKDVGTGTRGTYVDISDVKHYRPNKFGQVEPRDPHRLRDRNGDAILCFRCGTSALPSISPTPAPGPSNLSDHNSAAASHVANGDVWKNMITCDYCDLHWHLDCLDTPRLTMPSSSKKFMCPNHAVKVHPPKHRIPKTNAPPIDVKKTGQYNNGNIDVVNPIIPPTLAAGHLDETIKYGRKFRVPEKVLLLDFWSQVSGPGRNASPIPDNSSISSSPLTSLSSLSDSDDSPDSQSQPSGREDMEIAELLCAMAKSHGPTTSPMNGVIHSSLPNLAPPPPLPPTSLLTDAPLSSSPSSSLTSSTDATRPSRRRKKPTAKAVALSGRELRSRARTGEGSSSTSLPSRASSHSKTIVKMEQEEQPSLTFPLESVPVLKPSPRKARVARVSQLSRPNEQDTGTTTTTTSTPRKVSSNRKRKTRAEETTTDSGDNNDRGTGTGRNISSRRHSKTARLMEMDSPTTPTHSSKMSTTTTKSAPGTPLKIRLPPLSSNGVYTPPNPNPNPPPPTSSSSSSIGISMG